MARKQATIKNANGMGSMRWNTERQRYEHRVTVGFTDDGKQIRRMATGKTQEQLAQRIKALTETVAISATAPVGMTVGQWCNVWLADILPLERSSRSTKETYESRVRLYVVPYVGQIVLTELKPEHVRKMITAIRAKGLGGTTQHAAYKTLHRVLNVAMAEGYVTRNVASLVDAPARSVKEGRTLTVEQSRQLLTHLHGKPYEAPIVTLLTLGLRPGELGGITWNDVDLESNRVRIRRTLHKPVNGQPSYVTEGVAKTAESIRVVPLPEHVVEVLKRHRVKQTEERLAFGPALWGQDFPNHDFVFTRAGGSPINLDTLRHHMNDITTECGLGAWGPYEMRHSAISLMAAMGYQSKMIAEIAGNSPRIAEEVYIHVMDQAKRDALDAYSAAISPSKH